MKIVLVNMPWHALHHPSLALGILTAQTARHRPDVGVESVFANVAWAEYLAARTGGELGPDDYHEAGADLIHKHVGEWVFTSALYGRAWNVAEFSEFLESRDVEPAKFVRMHALAPGFIEDTVRGILDHEPDIVGFTTTFQQNVPSLAAARRLKALAPDVITVLGGANCDGSQGVAIARNFPFVDHVVRGDGEHSFLALISALERGVGFENVPGLCWRGDAGDMNLNREEPTAIDAAPSPDFDAYFERIANSPAAHGKHRFLVLESTRGCWWGAKRHCKFCGLNGSSIRFRAKPASRTKQEISSAVQRYKTVDVQMVDNIIDTDYFESLLPELAGLGWDLRLFWEVKSNLDARRVAALAAAGVTQIQPGIESLSTRVLRLMDKGVTGPQNIRVLRECEHQNVRAQWNILYGFPGETDDDYEAVLRQVPSLTHLRPPHAVVRLAIERFSPYFERPELGFADRRPAAGYRFVYDLPDDELADLVYMFDADPRGIGARVAQELKDALKGWRDAYPSSSLTGFLGDNTLRIADRRGNGTGELIELEAGFETESYLALERPHTLDSLHRELRTRSIDVQRSRLKSWLGELSTARLIFTNQGAAIALATLAYPDRPTPAYPARSERTTDAPRPDPRPRHATQVALSRR